VNIIDASVGHVISTLPAENVYELGFSPLGTYVITWQRPSKDEAGDAVKNLKVWRVLEEEVNEDGERPVVGRFVQKSQTGWNLQYTYDETYCARVVTNEIQFYESGDLKTVWNKLRVEGVTDFAVSPGKNHSIAVFVPERKVGLFDGVPKDAYWWFQGQPAAVKVFNVPQFATAVSQKNFFKGDKVQMKWNDSGTSLIVLAQTEVDKTGKSYYGETTLYLLSANGGFDSRIELGETSPSYLRLAVYWRTCADKEGPIHDVTWSPNSKEFGVVYGYMPAKTTIFNTRAVATHSFPLKPRNTILFSPRGRFVLVAGFGNLAGQMDIYDLEKDYEKVCTIEATNASVCEWSPDEKHILTATTSPRLRVDNGVRIWHVGGGLMYNEELNELYHVCWRPQSNINLPLDNPFHPMPTPHASALAYLGTVKTPSKPAGAYRPPGARGQITPLAFRREDEGGAAYIRDSNPSYGNGAATFGKPRRREVPGAEGANDTLPPGAVPGGGVSLTPGADPGEEKPSKAAAKNKKKREAKKAKEAAEKANTSLTSETGLDDAALPLRSTSPSRSPNRRDGKGHERTRSRGTHNMPNNIDHPGGRSSPHRRERSRGSPHRRQRSELGHPNGVSLNPQTPKLHPHSTPSILPPSHATPAALPQLSTITPASPPDLTVTSPTTPASAIPGSATAEEKKVRGLLKKLRAIDELKMRLAGGEKLEDTQMKKIRTEDGVRGELGSLGWNGE
jgi:translation initiation factor 2A